MSMFKFGGAGPDEEANIAQEMEGLRIELQRMNAENSMLRERIAQYEVLSRPDDLVLLTVKNFLFNVYYIIPSKLMLSLFRRLGPNICPTIIPRRRRLPLTRRPAKPRLAP